MSKRTPFDIAEFIRNNDFSLGDLEDQKKEKYPHSNKRVFKGYNDMRKTVLQEAKIKDGKFDVNESLKGEKEEATMTSEQKKHFLEIISTYNSFQEQMRRKSDLQNISETLGTIIEAARELTINEADDWFDENTVKRNMKNLDSLREEFKKTAKEARSLDTRMEALYEEMGMLLNRYFNIADIDEATMNTRLGRNRKSKRRKR